jgi:Holliday junction resolvase-like predicted endonuclease
MVEPNELVMNAQKIGAHGEKVVEAELLRHGWMPANINNTVRNAAVFDLTAHKGDRIVPIRVKTSGQHRDAFSLPYRLQETIHKTEFTVLVKIGDTRKNDIVFVMPTSRLRSDLDQFHRQNEINGVKFIGMLTLHLKGDPNKVNRGFLEKWKEFIEAWGGLSAVS